MIHGRETVREAGSALRTGIAVFCLLLALGSGSSGNAFAETLRLECPAAGYVPGPYLEVLEDPGKTLTITDVTQPPLSRHFRRNHGETVNFGISASAYWLRLTIAGNDPAREWFLASDRPFISSFRVYLPPDTIGAIPVGCWTVHSLGFSDIRDRRYPPSSRLMLALPPISEAPQTIYLRIADNAPLFLPLEICTAPGLLENARGRMFLIGLYLGIMLALALFNGFLFVLLHDRSYLWYVMYLAFLSFFFLSTSGIPYEHIVPSSPSWDVRIGLCFAALAVAITGIFARAFLFTSRFSPFADRAFKTMTAFSVALAALCPVVPLRALTSLFCVLGGAFPVLMIGSAVRCLRQGFRPARYFLLAWIFLGIGAIVSVLTVGDIIPFSIQGFLGVQIGSAAEALLLSFALADRIRTLQSEREAALREERHSQELALTDSLTGLYNARHFQERIGIESAHAESTGNPLSLLMLDVDNFKWYNDTHGHPEGDRVLESLGGTILYSIREEDTAFRCGGEEFAVILRGSPGPEALRVAERIRETWESRIPPDGDNPLFSPTVSIGVSEFISGHGGYDMVMRADRALYDAKRLGKNRCETEGRMS